MQKKIIVLAIASALVAPALAFADATVYGQVNVSADMVSQGNTQSTTAKSLVSNNSRIGLKGSEDMGGGMSAMWQMEGTVDVANGGVSAAGGGPVSTPNMSTAGSTTSQQTFLFNRNTYVGVKSDSMGTVILGRHDTPYKIATRKLDVFADTEAADNRRLMGGGYVHDTRLSDVAAYISPNFNGVTVAAAIGGKNALGGATALSLAGMYDAGPLGVSLAYQSITNTSTASIDTAKTAFKLGASYTMDAITVGGIIESLSNTDNKNVVSGVAAGTAITSSNFYLAGKYSLSGTDAVKVAFTSRGATSQANANNAATMFSVGYDHDMSKRTTVYALYSTMSIDNGATPVVNTTPNTISVGIKHSF